MPDRKLSPCARQTEGEIENYYRNQPEGSPAVVRRTHGGILTYQITTFSLRRTRTGRINVEGVGDFYMNRQELLGAHRPNEIGYSDRRSIGLGRREPSR